MKRRNLIKIATTVTAGLVGQKALAAGECLVPTRPQTAGPFYPEDWAAYETDADMTQLGAHGALATGQLAIVNGLLIDSKTCQPIAGATVDIWQANSFGQYFHDNDAKWSELKDKNFQYRCRVTTNNEGKFSIKTIKPSPYPASANWIRPPHIHFKVVAKNYPELTTQMYFGGDPLNPADRILQGMSKEERQGVIVDFQENNSKILEGTFTLSL